MRDYSQQPEKYISMAEHIVKIQNQTPPRFRSLPRTGALRKVAPPALKVQGSHSRSSKPQPSSSAHVPPAAVKPPADNQGEKAPEVKKVRKVEGGVKVARWPAQKVEPFKLTEYKKKEVNLFFHYLF